MILTYTIISIIILLLLINVILLVYSSIYKDNDKPASNDVIIIGDRNPYTVIYTDNWGKVETKIKLYQL